MALFNTKQELYDAVKKHLLTQNAKSQDEFIGVCLYRSSDGKKCAVGGVMPDELYNAGFNSKSVWSLPLDVRAAMFGDGDELIDLARELQSVHDGREVNEWPSILEGLAIRHNLTP